MRATIERSGAVSPETAQELADIGRRHLGVDFCLAVTGIAGPGGGTELKPVGTVHIALAAAGHLETHQLRLLGSRDHIRRLSVTRALDLLRRHLVSRHGATSL